jgi:hypothetical protein
MFEKKDLDTLEELHYEQCELQGKIARLKFALLNAPQLGIRRYQRGMMNKQLMVMQSYLDVLVDRITDLSDILDNGI